jgi:hypothetical protein
VAVFKIAFVTTIFRVAILKVALQWTVCGVEHTETKTEAIV